MQYFCEPNCPTIKVATYKILRGKKFSKRNFYTWNKIFLEHSPIVVIVFVVERCVWARGDCLHCARHSFLFKSFISRCMACSSSHLWDMWLPTREWFLLVCVVFTLPSRNLPFFSFRPCSGFGKLPCCWDLVSSGWWEPALWGSDPAMFDCCSH